MDVQYQRFYCASGVWYTGLAVVHAQGYTCRAVWSANAWLLQKLCSMSDTCRNGHFVRYSISLDTGRRACTSWII